MIILRLWRLASSYSEAFLKPPLKLLEGLFLFPLHAVLCTWKTSFQRSLCPSSSALEQCFWWKFTVCRAYLHRALGKTVNRADVWFGSRSATTSFHVVVTLTQICKSTKMKWLSIKQKNIARCHCIGSKQENSQGPRKRRKLHVFFKYRILINVFEINPNKSCLIFQVFIH